jgi:CheY-like chemotaxis protein
MAGRVLVVDDDPMFRELLAIHLRNAGYEVQAAADAVEAGHALLRERVDILIVDVNMPHLDGFEFVEALRADSATRDIPVIFLTTAEEGELRGKVLGAVGYVPKPVRADRLLSVVAPHLPPRPPPA